MVSDGLYYTAATILRRVRAGEGRIKTLCYGANFRSKKVLLALVSESCKNWDLLENTIKNANIPKDDLKNRELVIVLLHDLLLQKCQPDVSKTLLEPLLHHREQLDAAFAKVKLEQKDSIHGGGSPRKILRYARINTLKSTLKECCEKLKADGYTLLENEGEGREQEWKKNREFAMDGHLQDLLVFPPSTDLTSHPLYRQGSLILQDKASCMPAAILNPPPHSHVLDACAAPGNKTTQLAAIVGPTGKVYAFERDRKRAKILQGTLQKHGCSHVQAICADFLKVDPTKYPNVQYALVDPSCSGSGVLEEYELTERCKNPQLLKERLVKLSNFQCMILRHAMKFPNLKRVVYSTCSIYAEENEEVVRQVLEAEPRFILVKQPLPSWSRRGLEQYDFAQDVIRADPLQDGMFGFFVACFERRDGGGEGEGKKPSLGRKQREHSNKEQKKSNKKARNR